MQDDLRNTVYTKTQRRAVMESLLLNQFLRFLAFFIDNKTQNWTNNNIYRNQHQKDMRLAPTAVASGDEFPYKKHNTDYKQSNRQRNS